MSDAKLHLTVATLVERDNRYLMVREIDHGKEVYNQPAGHWEHGETLREAAIRETLEETGWKVELSAFLGVFMSASGSGDAFCRIAFIARPLEHYPDAKLDPDIIAADWYSMSELQALRGKMRSVLVMRTLEAYWSGQSFDLDAVDAAVMPYPA